MLLINQKKVKEILPLTKAEKANDLVELAFADYYEGQAIMPPKQYLEFKKDRGDLRVMPAHSLRLEMASTKMVNVHPENRKKDLQTVMATIVLNDTKTGKPLSFMDGTYITGMRTGASSAVSVKHLARKDAKTLGLLGTGGQAPYQLATVLKAKHFEEIRVCDIDPERIKELEVALSEAGISVELKKVSAREAVESDVLITLTPVSSPIVKREWIKPGTHICAIGADAKGKQEMEGEILKEAKVVVDEIKQAAHSGEINVPLKEGTIKEEDIYASLGEVVSNAKKGRINDEEITIFDSTGLAIQDLYLAEFVYRQALESGEGEELSVF